MINLTDITSLIAAVTGVIGVIFLFIEWRGRLKWKATYSIHEKDDGTHYVQFRIRRFGEKEACIRTCARNKKDTNDYSNFPVFKSRYLPGKKPLASLISSNPTNPSDLTGILELKPKDKANEESLISAIQANKAVWLKFYYQDCSISQKIKEQWIKAEPEQ